MVNHRVKSESDSDIRVLLIEDSDEYAEVIGELLSKRPELESVAFDDPDCGMDGERTETNFEIKYLREGRTIYRFSYRRR